MNHKTGTVLRLTLREAAERWATECRSIGPETLAALLAECALKGGFEFALAKDEPAPWNFDPELGKVVEVFDRDGRPKTAYELSFGHFAPGGSTTLTNAELQELARNVTLTLQGLSRFCAAPEFAGWAALHDLDAPRFLPRAGAEPPAPAAPGRRGFSRTKVEEAYVERIKSWPADTRSPSQKDDVTWGKLQFGKVPREFLRELRRRHAPPAWTKGGAPKKPSQK